MAAYANTEFWTEFIRMYKSFPETWDFQHEGYKNKRIRNKAYEKLLEKLQSIEPKATELSLKKRINNLRSCFRRELKKMKESQRSGAKEIYKPTLWYFDELSFVQDQGTQNDDETLIDIDPEGNYYSDTDELSEDIKPNPSQIRKHVAERVILNTSQPKRPRTAELVPNTSSAQKDHNADFTRTQRTELLLKAINHLDNACTTHRPNEKDEAEIFGASWTTLFRKLSPDQQLYANKTIVEVLYQGALGNLNEYSYKGIEPPMLNKNQ